MEMELSELSKKDTAEERCKLFVRDAVTSTMKEIKDIINASLDKDKANVVNMSHLRSPIGPTVDKDYTNHLNSRVSRTGDKTMK